MKPFFWVILFVFVDVLGFSIILPLLPYYAEDFDASPSIIGLILTSNALSQMIAAPYLGKLSDQHGRRPILIICLLGTIVSFLWLALARNTYDLFFSRILDGLLGGNISLAQAYISDITTKEERTKSLGFVGAAFGIGFVVGPAIGGSLSVYGYRFPAFLASFVSLINLIGVYFNLPESLPIEKRNNHSSDSHSLGNLVKCFKIPKLGSLMVLRFVHMFSFTIFETCFGFFNMERLGLDARRSSYLLCYVGLVFSMVQGGGVKSALKRLTEGTIILYSCLILSASLMFWSFSHSFESIVLSLFPLSLASGFLNTLINSEITKQVEQSELGGTLGVSASIGSLTRVMAPICSGLTIDQFGVNAPGFIGSFLMFFMFFFSKWKQIDRLGMKIQ
eukprot:TRINITY_DN210_c0_g1_i1.p1 TRINITY_DN210_c0_g1~~TRINITY_DN210_c0_g1_i1.p1  ORF type:complete len:391 (+),score=61.00 TRINITY_DN210_c0_g1_i1:50-1222(+)